MDKGTWIALGVMVFATMGVAVLLLMPEPAAAPTSSAGATTATPQNCQALAAAAAAQAQSATGETISVIEAHFNQAQQACYYEVNIFGSAGNTAAIKSAASGETLASCTTDSSNVLSCKKADGTAITEPQFKALLTDYLEN
jgi:hypothetical protein